MCSLFFEHKSPCYTQSGTDGSRMLPNFWCVNVGAAQLAHITEWKLAEAVIRRSLDWS